jgi:hypothetical protein
MNVEIKTLVNNFTDSLIKKFVTEVVLVQKENVYEVREGRYIILKLHDDGILEATFELTKKTLRITLNAAAKTALEDSVDKYNIKLSVENKKVGFVDVPKQKPKNEEESSEEGSVKPNTLVEDDGSEVDSDGKTIVNSKPQSKFTKRTDENDAPDTPDIIHSDFLRGTLKKTPEKKTPEVTIKKIKYNGNVLKLNIIEGEFLMLEENTGEYYAFLPIGKDNNNIPCAVAHKNNRGNFVPIDSDTKSALKEMKLRFLTPEIITKLSKEKFNSKHLNQLKEFSSKELETDSESD